MSAIYSLVKIPSFKEDEILFFDFATHIEGDYFSVYAKDINLLDKRCLFNSLVRTSLPKKHNHGSRRYCLINDADINKFIFKRFITERSEIKEIKKKIIRLDNNNSSVEVLGKGTFKINYLVMKKSLISYLEQKNITGVGLEELNSFFGSCEYNNFDDYAKDKIDYLLNLNLDSVKKDINSDYESKREKLLRYYE